MAIYTVHVPDDTLDHMARADRTVFVREGFSGWALIFGLLFLLWYRLFLSALIFVLFAGVLGSLCWVFHVPVGAAVALGALMHLFVAVEGNDLRRWSLDRRGLRCVDVVSGPTRDDAELAFFHRQPAATRSAASVTSASFAAADMTPAVIGMFPDGSP